MRSNVEHMIGAVLGDLVLDVARTGCADLKF